MVILPHETQEAPGDVRVRVLIPASFRCPITCEVMVDPVQTDDGHVYDRKSIAEWFGRGHHTSPMTGLRLQSLILTPLEPLRRAIEDYMEKIFPHLAYVELDEDSPQKALDRLTAMKHTQKETSNVNDRQRRAWKKMMLTAAKRGDAYVIRGFHEAETCGVIEILTRQGFSLSLAAVKNGNKDVLEALVEVGVALDKTDVDGSTLMHYAVRQDDVSIIEVLIRLGAPMDTMNSFGPPLCTASYYGNVPAIHALSKSGVQANQSRDALGYHVLQVAARREGNTEVIKELCTFGVPAYSDEAPFMLAISTAAYYGHLKNLETLLVHMASHGSSLPKSSWTWPFDAVWNNNASAVLELLHSFHVPLDTVDSNFEYLDLWNMIEHYRIMVKKEEEHRKLNYFSFTPGDYAVQSINQHRLTTMQQLGEAWKAIGTHGCEGQTAMHWAAICCNCKAIHALRSFGVSLTAEDSAGCTPAHFAALMGHVEVLELLNNLDVPLNIVSYSGFNPVDYAKQVGHGAAVSYLQLFDQ